MLVRVPYTDEVIDDCLHSWICETHLGEVMDTLTCLECGVDSPRFVGPNRVGSILYMPEEKRPRSSRSFIIPEGGNSPP